MKGVLYAALVTAGLVLPCAAQELGDYELCSLSHEQESRYDTAIDACSRIISNFLIPIETRAEAYVYRGKYVALRGDYRSALKDLERAVAANPHSHYARDVRDRLSREAAMAK